MREKLIECFQHALKETHPTQLTLANLPETTPSLIVAVGKAALSMLEAARQRFPNTSFIATPKDEGLIFPKMSGGKLIPASHPVPDKRSLRAAETILEALARLGENDLVLLLVSGGGSSLLSAPWGISLEEKQLLTQALLRSGADIQEINTVRKHFSRVKGGRLLKATKAKIVALYLSDVPGDDLSTIASGPTAPDPSTFAEALAVLDKYGLDFSKARIHLQRGVEGKLPESPKPNDDLFTRIQNKIIGSNQTLLEAAHKYWQQQGFSAVILSDRFQGEAKELARFHAALIQSIRTHHTPFRPPVVLLSGGETSVRVDGNGRGGRNQEFLAWLVFYLREQGVWALAADSDGIDGNSEAAGAISSPLLWDEAHKKGVDLKEKLNHNDSNGFFAAMDSLLVTGGTANNLNDFRVMVVE